MIEGAALGRFAAAMIYSGIFWATILFLIDACALNRRVPFFAVGALTGLLALAIYLFVGVVTTPEAFAMAW